MMEGMSARVPASVEGKAPCDRRRVLIVDDEAAIRRLFELILASELPQHLIDVAEDGQEAVRSFLSGHHAVLLMDLRMPVMDGRAAFSVIEQECSIRNWEMPSVVFCTGFAPPDSVRRIVEGNPSHSLVAKPVSNERLIEAVRTRLAGP